MHEMILVGQRSSVVNTRQARIEFGKAAALVAIAVSIFSEIFRVLKKRTPPQLPVLAHRWVGESVKVLVEGGGNGKAPGQLLDCKESI
jgi:hypothetical protein